MRGICPPCFLLDLSPHWTVWGFFVGTIEMRRERFLGKPGSAFTLTKEPQTGLFCFGMNG